MRTQFSPSAPAAAAAAGPPESDAAAGSGRGFFAGEPEHPHRHAAGGPERAVSFAAASAPLSDLPSGASFLQQQQQLLSVRTAAPHAQPHLHDQASPASSPSRSASGRLRLAEVIAQLGELQGETESIRDQLGNFHERLMEARGAIKEGDDRLGQRVAAQEAAAVAMRQALTAEVEAVRRELQRAPEVRGGGGWGASALCCRRAGRPEDWPTASVLRCAALPLAKVSFADFTALASRVDGVVGDVASIVGEVAVLRDDQMPAVREQLDDLRDQVTAGRCWTLAPRAGGRRSAEMRSGLGCLVACEAGPACSAMRG